MRFEQHLEHSGGEPAKELLWTLSSQGFVRSISSYFAKITAWNETDCRGKSFSSFIHPDDIARIKKSYPHLYQGETVQLDAFRCLTRKGSYLTFSLSLAPLVQNGILREVLVLGSHSQTEFDALEATTGNILPFLSTKEKSVPTTAFESAGMAKLLESLLANAPVGFALLDENLRFVCLNQAFSAMTGFSPEQQLGLTIRDFLPNIATVTTPLLERILLTGNSLLDHEITLQKTAASEASHYALMSFYPIPDGRGGTCGIAIIGVDITERKRANQKLKTASEKLARSNEALETFCHTVSHDLNEPLRTIACYVKLLERKCKGSFDEDADDYIQYTLQGTEHMRYLIDGLLDFARAGHSEVKTSVVDCGEIMRTVANDLKAVIQETGSTLTYEALPSLTGNRLLLLQVLQNLVANAIKFRSSEPCRVHVAAEKKPNEWVLSVADNGIGIKEKYLPTIFTPFKRLHAQSQYAGAGLGLAICQKNIERLGGKVWVTSEEGKGSLFSFSIPVAPSDEGSGHVLT